MTEFITGLSPDLGWGLILEIFLRFLLLSLLATGGALSLAPAMHKYLVVQKGLITDTQFIGSIALAQSAPGPNVLFVTVLGWQAAGFWGALAMTVGCLIPSAVLAVYAGRKIVSNPNSFWMRGLREGLAPIAIGLTFATAVVLLKPWITEWRVWLLTIASISVAYFTRLAPIYLIAVGAAIGAFGFLNP
ncbi:MAG: chromate transporter [Burkholderiaceae bacterium]